MKKILIFCWLITLFLLVAYIIYHINWKECQPLDYRIDDVSMERILLDDSTCDGHRYYLIRLSITPVHYKCGFRVSSVRPYIHGCIDSILDVAIESRTHKRLDDYILDVVPMRYDPLDALYLISDSIHKNMGIHCTLQIVKKRIQNNYPLDILISMDSLAPPPQYVIFKLQGREIRVTNKTGGDPHSIKTMFDSLPNSVVPSKATSNMVPSAATPTAASPSSAVPCTSSIPSAKKKLPSKHHCPTTISGNHSTFDSL